MIIYEFTTWGATGELYTVREIEVEEKPKIYVSKHRCRINKNDIDKLQHHYGNRMYRLDSDPKPYITAMTNLKKRIMENATENLKRATADFNKWFDLKEMVGGEG